MESRTLSGPPGALSLYARTAAPLLPGASLLPFVPGGGGEIPEVELELAAVRAEPERVAAYARVCGFALRDTLPPTYPQVLAFPLQMALMADGSFPFGAIGLIHLENRIEQRRPIRVDEELALRVRPTPLRAHPTGQTFSILTEARTGTELAWTSEATMLRRGGNAENALLPAMRAEVRSQPAGTAWEAVPAEAPASAEWRLDSGLGRRYAGVSGDRNPIHMHSLTAKPLGFPAAIAHGMWTKARCLAALESRLPPALTIEARFRKPILLPARVELASEERDGGEIAFAVRDPRSGAPHLDGRARAVVAGPEGDAADLDGRARPAAGAERSADGGK